MAWRTYKYQRRNMSDDTVKVRVGVSNQATGERYEVDLDNSLTDDQMLDALAVEIKALRVASDLVNDKLDTTTLEGKINALP
jgi:hypothetical protein